ncbi:hypothetical protein [Aliiglaciecola sp. LCG003]|uniref:hypothetical protein n=1 Tax=Aliiglaciecola sp. LCG003 TaxID=3053655 RepID=UPI002572D5E0|nr:hypothetical protein [Aliiglaciecola sp. LCG003]WJG09068.1 hypothetical protein QR722_17330 [Aliiglaciecola sp. LCG003]
MQRLTDCTLLSKIFAAEIIELEKSGGDRRRSVNMRGHQFIERITHLSDTEIVYQIEGNGPVKNHQGQIVYIESSDGPYLHYQIHGQSNSWVPTCLLKVVMNYDFKLAAKRLKESLSER